MSYLPLANILHYKLRSAFSAFGIGVGICMLVTLAGLARGSLSEIADRWESVQAQLIAFPRGWSDNVITLSGIGLGDAYRDKFQASNPALVERIAPVFLWQIRIGGQDNMSAGIDAADWNQVTGGQKLLEGRLPDPDGKFAAWLESKLLTATSDDTVIEIPDSEIAQHGGLEMVVDSRLARKGHFQVDQSVEAAGHNWKIVGIAPAGVMTRVFIPRRAAQFFFGNGSIQRSTLQFIKLKSGIDPNVAATKLSGQGADIMQLKQYRGKLEQKFGIMFKYINAVNAIALIIAFLFIMVTLYMMVLQRTREIAILKSCGASDEFILRQIVCESMLLTAGGTAFGILLSFPAAWLIETIAPLLTVQISFNWIGIAILAATAGSLFSAIYPAWRAMRVDMVSALTLE